jgi:hypothetical protein
MDKLGEVEFFLSKGPATGHRMAFLNNVVNAIITSPIPLEMAGIKPRGLWRFIFD